MKRPEMILFDYGQTLVNERSFDGVKGTQAVLKYAVKNKYNRTAEEIQAVADKINDELGRYGSHGVNKLKTEVPNYMFTSYLYQSQGIELSIAGKEIDRVFWDAAAPGDPTEGIQEFLCFLREQKIRTGVISNIPYDAEVVSERINRLIENDFEFIIATSEYLFRKPSRRIFELALEKAELSSENVWYVGDNYLCDVEGARNAGLFPVWYIGAQRVPCAENDDVLTVRDWKELSKIISDEGK